MSEKLKYAGWFLVDAAKVLWFKALVVAIFVGLAFATATGGDFGP